MSGYLLKMVRVEMNYCPKRGIKVEGDQIKKTITPPYTIAQDSVPRDKDKTVEKMVSEHGVPDSIRFHDFGRMIEEDEEVL